MRMADGDGVTVLFGDPYRTGRLCLDRIDIGFVIEKNVAADIGAVQ